MNILILGGTGLVGTALTKYFSKQNNIRSFGREIYNSDELLKQNISWSDAIIQLSGATISKRWTEKYKKEIWDSRIKTNQKLAEIYNETSNNPKVIFASAVGFYPESTCKAPLDENDIQPGSDYLAQLAKEWEAVAKAINEKVLIFRFGVVLSKKGGALKEMLPMYKIGLGGPIGDGKQCFPWVHIDDLVRGIAFGLDNNLEGTYNLTSPQIISQKDFGKALSKTLNRPFFIKTYEWQLGMIFGEGSQVLVKSLAVSPNRLISEKFNFVFPDISKALKNILD